MKIKKTYTGGYSLTPHKRPTDPYSLPSTKGDLHELKDALIWPPEITRNIYGKKMQDILKQHKNLLTSSTRLTPQEVIYQSIDLSNQFYNANKKYFETEANKVPSGDQAAIPIQQPPAAPAAPPVPVPEPSPVKASPYAIKRAVQESKKTKLDSRKKLLKDFRDEEVMKNFKKSYREKRKSVQSMFNQMRLAGRIK